MSTYSKFRLWIIADNRQFGGGNWFCNIAELDLLDNVGAEISYAGASYSSSGHFSTNDAASAFDANNATCWSGDANGLPGTPIWLRIDLAAPTDVRSFGIRAFTDTSAPSDFILQGSNDGSTWDTIADPDTTYTWTSGQYRTWLFDSGSPTKAAHQQLIREVLRDGGSPDLQTYTTIRETLRSSATGATLLLLRSTVRETLRSGDVVVPPDPSNRRKMSFM